MSCSPGIVIDASGTWHMYFIGSLAPPGSPLYLYHATASAPGINWTIQGTASGIPQGVSDAYLETPSPLLINGQIVLYYVGTGGYLFRATSSDGQNFTTPQQVTTADVASHGHVAFY